MMRLRVFAPVTGTVVAMTDVDDPVFSAGFVGPGLAIEPDPVRAREVRAPIDGRIVKLHPHAFIVLGERGLAVLVHLGIDTVQLAGEGFTVHTEQEATVRRGQVVVGWDPASVAAGGRSAVCPVVVLDAASDAVTWVVTPGDTIEAGAELLTWG